MCLQHPMIKAVIFDMDGVIIDSEPFHWEVNRRIFSLLGIDVSEKEYCRYIGVSNTSMWTDIRRGRGLRQSVEELVEMQVNGNIDFMKNERVDPVGGVIDLIAGLKKAGLLLAVASSSPYRIIEMVLEKFVLRRYFDGIVSGEDFENGKPAPDIFLAAAVLLKVTPDQCVVIEDATHGVEAAKAARMKCIGFHNIHSPGQKLGKADMVIDDFTAIGVSDVLSLAET
jgi:HAD superfamily hydrolase (TIGR01509 family)